MNHFEAAKKTAAVSVGRRYALFANTCLMIFLFSVILYLPSPLLTSISEETGWTLGQAGMLVGMYTLFAGIFTFFAAPLVDRFGTRRTAILSLALAVPGGLLALAGSSNYYVHCLGRILSGAGFGIMFPVPGTLISEHFPRERVSLLLSIRTTADFVGCSLSYYLTIPIFRLLHSWQHTFAVWSLAALLPLGLYLVIGELAPLSAPEKPAERPAQKKSSWGIAVRQKWLWLIAVGMLGCCVPLYGFGTYLPAYLEFDRGYSAAEASAVAGLIQIAGMFAGAAAVLIDRTLGRRKILGWGSMLCILLGAALTLFTSSGLLISIGTFIIGLSVGLYMIFYSTVPSDILGGSHPGVYAACISLTFAFGNIAGTVVPGVFQGMLDCGFGIKTALLLFTVPSALALIPCCIIRETGPRGRYARMGAAPYPPVEE